MSVLFTFLQSWSALFSEDPFLQSLQIGLLALGSLLTYLVFFTTRDIVLRTRSFLYQVASILLVALLPGVGFLLYLLIRPARTVKERAMEKMLMRLVAEKIKADLLYEKKRAKPWKKRFPVAERSATPEALPSHSIP